MDAIAACKAGSSRDEKAPHSSSTPALSVAFCTPSAGIQAWEYPLGQRFLPFQGRVRTVPLERLGSLYVLGFRNLGVMP